MANFEQSAPVEPDALPPVLDVEATPTSRTCHRHLTQAGAIRDMQIMLDEMDATTAAAGHHTTVDFYQRSSPTATSPISDLGAFDQYHPSVRYAGRDWRFSAVPVGRVHPRDPRQVDRDAFSGTREQWTAFLQRPDSARPAPARPAEPAPPPVEVAATPAPEPAATALVEQPAATPAPDSVAAIAPPLPVARPAPDRVVEALAPETPPEPVARPSDDDE